MRSFPVHIFTALVFLSCLLSLFKIYSLLAEADSQDETEAFCEMEYVLSDMQPSNGNSCGLLYSLDGKQMTERRFASDDNPVLDSSITRSDGKKFSMPTEEYYASVVGIDNDYASGLLTSCKRVLKANAAASNRRNAVGDSLITTIVSSAQEEAYAQLQDFNGIARWSSIVVVSNDGAVLVDSASNSKAIMDYDQKLWEYYVSGSKGIEPQPSERLYTYQEFGSSVPECVGSSFKPVTARLLALHDECVSTEFSLRNEFFEDVPELTVGSDTIHNHDYTVPGMYPRQVSLAKALAYSSNTYFLSHVQNFGMQNYMDGLIQQFRLDQPIWTDAHEIPAMPLSAEDANTNIRNFLEKVSYGQEARLTPVRLASLYNYIISGEWYDPFFIAQVREPSNQVIFSAVPVEREEYHFDIDMYNDILINGLSYTFRQYADAAPSVFDKYADSLISSGRILTKSGTADKVEGESENHTMVLTLLDERREHVVCTAVIAVDYLDVSLGGNLVSASAMIDRLLPVLNQLGVL